MKERNEDRTRTPIPTREQESPAPERPLNAQEEAGESLQEMAEPPQAEGDRESADR